MPQDGLEYLHELAERRLGVAAQIEARFRVEAVQLALAELRGAADALVTVGAVEEQPARRLVAEAAGNDDARRTSPALLIESPHHERW